MENTISEKKLEDSEILRGLLNKLDISADKFRKKLGYKSAATMGLILNDKIIYPTI